MQESLKKIAAEHYSKQNLSAQKLGALSTLLLNSPAGMSETMSLSSKQLEGNQNGERQFTIGKQHRKWYQVFAVAAMVMLMVTTFYMQITPSDIGREIANEVVANHLRERPLEVIDDNFVVVSAYLIELDFSPVKPSASLLNNASMLGGRYCSIKSEIAAQIRYKDAQDRVITLYQVKFDADKFGDIPPLEEGTNSPTYVVNGFQVTLWTNNGLMMALVSPI